LYTASWYPGFEHPLVFSGLLLLRFLQESLAAV
jgi:hypothetical protein